MELTVTLTSASVETLQRTLTPIRDTVESTASVPATVDSLLKTPGFQSDLYREMAGRVNYGRLAEEFTASEIAEELDICDLAGHIADNLSLSDIADNINTSDLAESVADNIDIDEVASRLVKSLDLDEVAKKAADAVLPSEIAQAVCEEFSPEQIAEHIATPALAREIVRQFIQSEPFRVQFVNTLISVMAGNVGIRS